VTLLASNSLLNSSRYQWPFCHPIFSFTPLTDWLTDSPTTTHSFTFLTAPLFISYDVVAYLLGVYDKVEAESEDKGQVQGETDEGKEGEGLQALYMKELKVS
jgi:hypothetical protein